MTARNIAQFAVLADHVRHPLQVVMGIADLLDDKGLQRNSVSRSGGSTCGSASPDRSG